MKRNITVNYAANQADGLIPGDAAAHRAAAALADRADMPTLDAFATMLSLLEHVGGQFYVTALRVESENGEFDTAGLIINYETRDARIEYFDRPDVVAGVPIVDSAAPTTEAAPEPEAEDEDEEIPEDAPVESPEPEPALSD